MPQSRAVAWTVQNLTKGSLLSVLRWLASLALLSVAVSCGGGSGNNGGGGNTPSLAISPPSTTVIAGGARVNFTATFANTTGTATWNLTGPGGTGLVPTGASTLSESLASSRAFTTL